MRFPVFALCASALFVAFGSVTKARMNDIPGTAYVVTDVTLPASIGTNDVCAIVTNTVDGGYSAWTFFSDNAELESALAANPPKVESEFWADLGMTEWLVTFPDVDGFEKDYQGSISVADTYDAPPVELYCGPVYTLRRYNPEWEGYEWIRCNVSATRKKLPARNALGLAMAKDVVSAEAVTNIARDVSNSFWDEKNSVLWRLDFRDGEPVFLPVTNTNAKAGGVM